MKTFFNATQFTPTKWEDSARKAAFANKLLCFMLCEFPQKQFTHALYGRLMHCFGHIAHTSALGFWDAWFTTVGQRADFIAHLLRWPCYGDPEYTYSDVERAIQQKVRDLNLLDVWRARAASDLRERELVLLNHLQKKYQPATVVPVPTPKRLVALAGEQMSLIA